MADNPTHRLHLLDGMRGIAAIAVMLYHEAGLYGPHRFLAHSYLAVDFFLLLSGFVLARAFEPKFASGLKARAFMGQRLKRLVPLMTLGTLLGAVHFALAGEPGNLAVLLALALLFVPRLAGLQGTFPLNGVQWSLLLEFIINLAHATGLRRLSNRALLALSGACALIVLRAALHYGTLDLGWQEVGIWAGLARAGFAYGLGIVMARTIPLRAKAPGGRAWLAPLILLPVSMWSISALSGNAALFGGWAVMVAGFPLLLWLALETSAPSFAVPALDWIGRLSFPLYAIHLPLLSLAQWWGRLHPGGAMPARIGGLALALCLAALLAETPLGGGGRRRPPALTRALPEPAPAQS